MKRQHFIHLRNGNKREIFDQRTFYWHRTTPNDWMFAREPDANVLLACDEIPFKRTIARPKRIFCCCCCSCWIIFGSNTMKSFQTTCAGLHSARNNNKNVHTRKKCKDILQSAVGACHLIRSTIVNVDYFQYAESIIHENNVICQIMSCFESENISTNCNTKSKQQTNTSNILCDWCIEIMRHFGWRKWKTDDYDTQTQYNCKTVMTESKANGMTVKLWFNMLSGTMRHTPSAGSVCGMTFFFVVSYLWIHVIVLCHFAYTIKYDYFVVVIFFSSTLCRQTK